MSPEQSQNYTNLIAELERHGPTILHPEERQTLTEAADALLFSESGRQEKLSQAEDLLTSLAEHRSSWSEEMAVRVRGMIRGCDAPSLVEV